MPPNPPKTVKEPYMVESRATVKFITRRATLTCPPRKSVRYAAFCANGCPVNALTDQVDAVLALTRRGLFAEVAKPWEPSRGRRFILFSGLR